MRALLTIALVLAGGTARADYACSFTESCLAGGICQRDKDLSFALTRGADGWRAEAPDATIPMTLSPEAGTYFGHVFVGALGSESGMDAYQLSVARDGLAYLSVHHVGNAPFGFIWSGRCEVVG